MTRQHQNATAGASILERKLESWRDARQDLLASPTGELKLKQRG